MRLFVAVDPPAEAVADLADAVSPLRRAHPSLRWGDPAQWHLTLTFCGDVEERVAERLATRLERAAARHDAIPLRLAGGGAFPRPARAGVLWVGLDGDVTALSRVADSTSAAARRERIAVEDRRYRPHLTVARVAPQADLREVVAALSSYAGPEWTATEIHLVHSRLGAGERRRAVHERIGTWPLRAT